jgi:hypothetical protein
MQRTGGLRTSLLVVLMVLLAAGPAFARRKKKKRIHVRTHHHKVVKHTAPAPEPPRPEEPPPAEEPKEKVVTVEVPEDAVDADDPASALPTPEVIARTGFGAHRYAYIGGAVVLATGLVFAYYAQGEAKRAETVGSAKETASALANARGASAAADVMYLAAGSLIAYALLVEVLPQRLADKVSFTFHF